MRLTLRTLLAYLDDVLDPSDKEELSHKIETSDFAVELVHRTRDTMRRLRLSAPQVIGTGMGLDPNSVAEYLDNMLPPDQVGDFERICLESDVHLAEAAACHHVLTMVLGEPAEVDPRMRQRMYNIPAFARERKQLRVEPAHSPAAPDKPAPASATTPISRQPTAPIEIPEYLRTRRWWQSGAVLTALAALLLVSILFFFGSAIRGWFGNDAALPPLALNEHDVERSSEPAPPAASPSATPSPATTDDTDTAPDAEPAPAQEPTPLPALGTPPQPATPGLVRSAPSTTPDASPAAPEDSPAVDPEPPLAEPEVPAPSDLASAAPDRTPTGDADSEVASTTIEPEQAPPADVPDGAAPPTTARVSPYDLPPEALSPPSTTDDDAPLLAEARTTAPLDADALDEQPIVDEPPATEPPITEEPAGPPELGTYLGGKTILLRFDQDAGAWLRVEPRAGIVAGQRLVALPVFRPKVTLTSGVHLDISGGSEIVLSTAGELTSSDAPADPDAPAIQLTYGRIVLLNTSSAENTIRLVLGSSVADAVLERNATLGVEVEPQYVPGVDPRQTPSPVVVRLFAPDGGVTWRQAGEEMAVDSPSRWTIENGETSPLAADDAPPEWIDQEPVLFLSEQRFGAPVVESTLVSNRPADTQLLELFQGSGRKEVKSLVARSSIHVGLFEPFIDALRDSEQKANWNTHIETLRSAMALSPDRAQSVHRALVEQRGERAAADLWEMLCGYTIEQIGTTPEETKTGALVRLINWLEEDSLDYRVLAVHNLAEITGKRLMPNPAAGVQERSQNIRRWRSRLESGELRPVGLAP